MLPNELENNTLADAKEVMENFEYLDLKAGGGVGFISNYKIVPSVVSNNLTVALKTMSGADPSPNDPVFVRIGDTIHKITSALSVTKNAGANWFYAGSAELATKEIDYFVYLGYNATDGVVIGFARIPFANLYSDFSTTTTNAKYCAISTITNAVAGDEYTVIGRFSATLSAGTGYTWSVPTFTASNLIQRPIFETRLLSFLPGVNGWSGTPSRSGYYRVKNKELFIEQLNILGTSNSTTSQSSIPFTPISSSLWFPFRATDNGTIQSIVGMAGVSTSSTVTFYKTFDGSLFTASGSKVIDKLTFTVAIAL